MKDAALAERCRRLRLVLSDVDGVMTDGTVLLLPGRRRGQVPSTSATAWASCWRTARACCTGILSGRALGGRRRSARAELGMTRGAPGRAGQGGGAARDPAPSSALQPHEVAYIGDDVNDLPVMRAVGLSAAPADAPLEVRAQAFMVTERGRRARLPARVPGGDPARARRLGPRGRGGVTDTALLAVAAGRHRRPRWPGGPGPRRAAAASCATAPASAAPPHYSQGLHYLAAGQAELAISELSKVAREDPEAVEVLQVLGNLLREIGQVERAIQLRHQALLAGATSRAPSARTRWPRWGPTSARPASSTAPARTFDEALDADPATSRP